VSAAGPEFPPCGILGVVKPPGMTSHDVVRVARLASGISRIGHLGTLDPPAAGVLPLAVGRATRLSRLLLGLPKAYRAEILFGVDSDTGDLAGEVVAAPAPPDVRLDALRRAVASLRGRQRQVPPAYSARKIRGKRLYDLARQGEVRPEQLAARARDIEVYRAECVSFGTRRSGPFPGYPAAVVDICCSGGTYVRGLATLAARELGTCGCVSFLLRTRSCGFGLADCLTVEQMTAASQLLDEPRLLSHRFPAGWKPAAQALEFLDGVVVAEETAKRVSHGAEAGEGDVLALLRSQVAPDCSLDEATRGTVRVIDASGRLIALAQRRDDSWRPYVVLVGGAPS